MSEAGTEHTRTDAPLSRCLLAVGVRLFGVWLLAQSLYSLAGIAFHILDVGYGNRAGSFAVFLVGLLLIRFDVPIARLLLRDAGAALPPALLLPWRRFAHALAALVIALLFAPAYFSAFAFGAPGLVPENSPSRAFYVDPEARPDIAPEMAPEGTERVLHLEAETTAVTLGGAFGVRTATSQEPSPGTRFFLGLMRLLALFTLLAWLLRPVEAQQETNPEESP